MSKAKEILKLLEAPKSYKCFKFKGQPPESAQSLKDLMPHLQEIGVKTLDLGDGPATLKALGVPNTNSSMMVDDVGDGAWAISLFKEPAFVVVEQ